MSNYETNIRSLIKHGRNLSTSKWFGTNNSKLCFIVEKKNEEICAYYLDSEKNKIAIDLPREEVELLETEFERLAKY